MFRSGYKGGCCKQVACAKTVLRLLYVCRRDCFVTSLFLKREMFPFLNNSFSKLFLNLCLTCGPYSLFSFRDFDALFPTLFSATS